MEQESKIILYDEKTTAAFLGLSAKTLQRWRWAGDGPRFIKLGGAVRYRLDDLHNFIENHTHQSTVRGSKN